MAYVVIRFIYMFYFGGAALILAFALSRAVFGAMPAAKLWQSILLAFLWPLALLAPNGRKAIRYHLGIR